jgi:hypothetical protein
VIYFIDEDHAAYGAWIAELELRGLGVSVIHNATDAFRDLWNISPKEVDLVLIDVMLAPGERVETPARSPDDYLCEGLQLLRDLTQQNASVFPARAVLLTNAVGPMLSEATRCGEEFGVPLWDKRSIFSPLHFGDRIVECLRQVRE